jgi:hypothetical protein
MILSGLPALLHHLGAERLAYELQTLFCIFVEWAERFAHKDGRNQSD